jgi:hypothetical protein
MTRLRVGRSGDRIPGDAIDFSLLQNVQTDTGANPSSYSTGTGVLSQEYSCRGVMTNSPSFSAKVKNEWNYISAPAAYLHGVDSGFTFHIYRDIFI